MRSRLEIPIRRFRHGVDSIVRSELPKIESVLHPLGTFYSVDPRPDSVWRPFRRLSRMNESGLVLPVANFVSHVDPMMSRAHGRRLRAQLAADYREIRDEAPGILALPGAIDLTINGLAGLHYDTGHYFAFLPNVESGESLGAMVFLHGNAGNFRLLIWRWRAFAARARLAILAPSCGFGFWRQNSASIVESVIDDARKRWSQIDLAHGFWLCGLSAGGNGVLRCADLHDWDGLVFVSATMRRDLIEESSRRKPQEIADVLVLNGLKDHNVGPGSVRRGVDLLRRKGAAVDQFVYDEEDHFLVFSQSDDLDRRMIEWMNSRTPARSSRDPSESDLSPPSR